MAGSTQLKLMLNEERQRKLSKAVIDQTSKDMTKPPPGWQDIIYGLIDSLPSPDEQGGTKE